MGRVRRPRGYVETLPSGSHRAVVYAGTDALTGKPRYLRKTSATAREAEIALTDLLHQVDQDRHPKSGVTVSQTVGQWLEVAKLEDTTRERYGDLIRLYITPILGPMQAGKIDAELLERFYARLGRCREVCGGRRRAGHECTPLSGSTVRKVHYILRAAFETATRWRQLGVNKVALADPPAPNRTEPDPPSAVDAARILNAAWQDLEWGLLLWFTMITGARRGEVSAIRWRHIDFKRQQIWIYRSNAQTKEQGVVEKDTKTHQRRKVALDPYTLSLLENLHSEYAERCKKLGIPTSADAFVFSPSPDSLHPYAPRSITQKYRRMALKLGLPSTRLHALRHYSATELLAAGVDLRTVAGRLGHGGGGATTLKVYAAWVDHADRQAATKMAELMPKPTPIPPTLRGPYQSIAAELREFIESGALPVGDPLPTIVELASRYAVAAGTAHRAVALLLAEGLISTGRGRRSVVVAKPTASAAVPAT